MRFYPRKPSHAVEELNLIPYMDIMTNLVMFMLVSTTGFVEPHVINVNAPHVEVRPTPGPAIERSSLVLAVVDKSGFAISVDGKLEPGAEGGRITVPQGREGFDYQGLTDRMEAIHRRQPALDIVTLVPDRTIDYATVVRVMDSIRRDQAGHTLYPDVLLGTQ